MTIPLEDLDLTSLPLDYFRQIMGIDPWHFWQMGLPTGCSGLYTHYRWLGGGYTARYDFIQAIVMAEHTLAQKLEFWPGLRYSENELERLTTPRQVMLYNRTPMKIRTHWARIRQVGKRVWTVLASVVPSYTTAMATVTVVFLPTGITADEIVVCYSGTHVQIRPIKVSIDSLAGTATITINKWLMADPGLWESSDQIDPTDNDNMLDMVDVYRVTYDSTDSILLAWEPELQACGCLSPVCVVCGNATQAACPSRGDYANGLVGWQAANYAAGAWTTILPGRYPELAYVSYLHGARPDPDPYMSMYWAQIVSHMAVALMDEADCGCGDVVNSMRYWKEDLSYSKDSSHQLGPMDLDNPFGARRGLIAAWKAVLMDAGED